MHSYELTLRQFIADSFLLGDPDASASLRDDDSLIEAGFVDSTGVLEIVAFLETQFGISVADDEVVPDNLDSVARLAAYVQRKVEALHVTHELKAC